MRNLFVFLLCMCSFSNVCIGSNGNTSGGRKIVSTVIGIFDKRTASELVDYGDLILKNGDVYKAVEQYEKAIKKNYAPAYLRLGKLWYEGCFLERDYKKAVGYLKKADELGEVEATYTLANCYNEGKGIDQDFFAARRLYLKAAEKEHLDAALKYIEYCKNGTGASRVDFTEAEKWENKSFVKEYRERLEKERLEKEQKLLDAKKYYSQGLFLKAVNEYRSLYDKYGDEVLSDLDCYYIGQIYSGEKGGKFTNNEKSAYWMKKAADKGNGDAAAYFKLYNSDKYNPNLRNIW